MRIMPESMISVFHSADLGRPLYLRLSSYVSTTTTDVEDGPSGSSQKHPDRPVSLLPSTCLSLRPISRFSTREASY